MSLILSIKKVAEASAHLYASGDASNQDILDKLNNVHSEMEKLLSGMSFICNLCKKSTNYSQAVSNKIYNNGACVCKSCDSERSKLAFMNGRAAKNPQDYLECNSCDRVFSKFSGRKKEYGNRPIVSICKFCGSDNIGEYL
jgi:hypothetical protein